MKAETPAIPPPAADPVVPLAPPVDFLPSELQGPAQEIVDACHAILGAVEAMRDFNKKDGREHAAMAGYVAQALAKVGGRFGDVDGHAFLRAFSEPASRNLYHYANQVAAMVFDCLRVRGQAHAENSKYLVERFAEVLPKHKRVGNAAQELEELKYKDGREMQARGIANAEKVITARSVRQLHERIRMGPGAAAVPMKGNPEAIIEMQPPHSSMGDIPGVKGSSSQEGELGAGNTVIGEIDVPRVS